MDDRFSRVIVELKYLARRERFKCFVPAAKEWRDHFGPAEYVYVNSTILSYFI